MPEIIDIAEIKQEIEDILHAFRDTDVKLAVAVRIPRGKWNVTFSEYPEAAAEGVEMMLEDGGEKWRRGDRIIYGKEELGNASSGVKKILDSITWPNHCGETCDFHLAAQKGTPLFLHFTCKKCGEDIVLADGEEISPKYCCESMRVTFHRESYPLTWGVGGGSTPEKGWVILLGGGTTIYLKYCPWCGEQFRGQCPTCRGRGELMHREWDPDDAGSSNTPYIAGCTHCNGEGSISIPFETIN